jgi:tRNA pseudouridine13 synthase
MVWKSEQRQVLVKPAGMELEAMAPDEQNEGRVKVRLRFQLPRGCYATMLLKRLFAQSWELRGPRYDRGQPSGAGEQEEDRRRGPWSRRPAPRLHSDEDFDE